MSVARRRRWASWVHVDGSRASLVLVSLQNSERLVFSIDPEAAARVAEHAWFPTCGYAATRPPDAPTKNLYLHWVVLGITGGLGMKTHVDHINRDRSDNRRANLRIGTARANHHNQRRQSKYGPCIYAASKPGFFNVRMRFGKTRVFHPCFGRLADAVRCRDLYLAVAQAVDDGRRLPPDKAELKAISDSVRATR